MQKLKLKKGLMAISQITAIINSLEDDKEYVCEIKEYRKKRSLSANSYYWHLAEEIARVLNTSKDEVHEQLLERYGTLLFDDNDELMKISSSIPINPIKCGIHCKFLGSSYLNEKIFYHYALIKGSSDYDSKEMSVLIDGVVSEAKELEIETLTPQEIALLEVN